MKPRALLLSSVLILIAASASALTMFKFGGGSIPSPLFMADNVTRRFMTITAGDNTIAKGKMDNAITAARFNITESGYEGEVYYSPGGGYTSFYPIEAASFYPESIEQFTDSELYTMLRWTISKHIADNTTTYTRPYSGGTDTYPLGTCVDYIAATGVVTTANYVPQGDKPLFTNAFGLIYLAHAWGYKVGFNGTFQAWWTANKTKVENAFNSIPYNPVTGLVTQYAGAYKAVGLIVMSYLDGDHYMESVWAYDCALKIARMHRACGYVGAAKSWEARANTIKAGVQAAFVTVANPLWDYVNEHFEGVALQSPSSTLPLGFYAVTDGTGTVEVLLDNTDATNKFLIAKLTSGSYYYAQKSYPAATIGTPFIGKYDRAVARSKPMQTDAVGTALYVNSPAGPVIIVEYEADGHIRYYTGSGFSNLPTDTTYSADTWYILEARSIWGGTNTAEILVNGVSKGTIPLLNPTQNMSELLWGANTVGATFIHDYSRLSKVPDNTSDTATCGYLNWAQGPLGKQFSPMATAAAVYYGVLTPTQSLQASRWLTLLLDQSDAGFGASDGRGELFSRVANLAGPVRWMRWADDWYPGYHQTYPSIAASYSYGYFINGGYMNWGNAWILRALNNHNPTKAAAYLHEIVSGMDNTGVNAPYEKLSGADKSVEGPKYLQPAIHFYEVMTP